VREIIRRELYAGVLVWNRSHKVTRRGTKSRRRRPESEWMQQEAPELGIVSEALWRAVERQREREPTVQDSIKSARGIEPLVHDLSERHHKALLTALRKFRIPHQPGTSPHTLVPFLLAGAQLAKAFRQLARQRRVSYSVMHTLADVLGPVLFPGDGTNPEAWDFNCDLAAFWFEKLRHVPADALILVRRCQARRCAAPFYLYAGGRLDARFCKPCGNQARQAAWRARRRQERVTSLRVKKKVSA
jgi:Recombinase